MNIKFSILRLCLLAGLSLLAFGCAPSTAKKSAVSSSSTGFVPVIPHNDMYLNREVVNTLKDWRNLDGSVDFPSHYVNKNDTTKYLTLRTLRVDLDPKAQMDSVISKLQEENAEVLQMRVPKGQSNPAYLHNSKGSVWSAVLYLRDSLKLISLRSKNQDSASLAQEGVRLLGSFDESAPPNDSLVIQSKQVQNIFGDAWRIQKGQGFAPGAVKLIRSSDGAEIHILSFELQSLNWPQDNLVANSMLAFGQDPESFRSHWQKIDSNISVNIISSDSIVARFWWSGNRLALIWQRTDRPSEDAKQPWFQEILGRQLLASAQISPRDEAVLLNLRGLQHVVEKENLIALSDFEKASELDTNEAVYLVNCAYVYQSEDIYGPGIQHLKQHDRLVRSSSRLSLAMAELERGNSNPQLALEYYRNAGQYLYDREEHVIGISNALWEMGFTGPSLDVIEDLYDRAPSQRLGLYLGKTLIGVDQYVPAIHILNEVKKRWGSTPDLRHHLALALMLQERYEDAMAEAATMVKEAPDSAEFWLMKGQIEYQLHRFRQAKASLDQALKLQKDLSDAMTLKSMVEGFLGEADIWPISKPIIPVVNMPAIEKMVQKNWTKDDSSANIWMHLRQLDLNYSKSTGWKQTEMVLLQVRSPEGARALDELSWSYLPNYDKFYPNAVLVLDSLFQIKQTANLHQFYLSGEKSNADSSENRLVHLPLKNIAVGDYVVFQTTTQSVDKNAAFPFVNHKASVSIPLGLDVVRVHADSGVFKHEVYGDMKFSKDGKIWVWSKEHPPTLVHEPYMPDYTEFGTGLFLSGFETWAQVGDRYLKMIHKQLMSSLVVQEKAFEIKGSENRPYNVARKLNDWVKNSVQYQHILFGGHALIPSKPTETLKRHMGDCKDKSVLLQAFLAAVGIPSDLALVSLDNQVFEGMISIEQFDHMVVHVPAGSSYPEMWLDPSEGANTARPVPYELEDKIALILGEDGHSHMDQVPVIDTISRHGGEFYHLIGLSPGQRIQVRDSIILHGKFADYFRSKFINNPSGRNKTMLREILSEHLSGVDVEEATVQNLQDYDKDFVIVGIYSVPFSGSQVGDKKWNGEFPAFWESLFLNLPKDEKRQYPLRLPQEHRFSSNFKFKGGEQQWLMPTLVSTHQYADNQCQLNSDKELTCQWGTLAALVDPADYGKLYSEWSQIKDVLQAHWATKP